MDQTVGKERTNSRSSTRKKGEITDSSVESRASGGNQTGAEHVAPRKAKDMKRKKKTARKLELSVVGLNHRVDHATLIEMQRALPLKCYFKREPENAADSNAIQVRVHPDNDFSGANWHFGYLRRQVAAELAPAMDTHEVEVLSCELVSLDMETQREGELTVVLSGLAVAEIGT